MSPTANIREFWCDLQRGRPGHRFQERYQRARKSGRAGPARRMLLLAAAVICLAIGFVLAVIPGPAIPFLFVAGGLLALESRRMAKFMDGCEVVVRKLWRWAVRTWRRLPAAGRITLAVLAIAGMAALAYLAFRLIRG